jgi:hypothetical protein
LDDSGAVTAVNVGKYQENPMILAQEATILMILHNPKCLIILRTMVEE